MVSRPPSLVDILASRADARPDDVAYRFVTGASPPETITYAQLDLRARSIAAFLRRTESVGERILLAHPAGLPFVEAFFGCLYAGCLAVPAFPLRANRTLPRVATMADDAKVRTALTIGPHVDRSRRIGSDSAPLARLRWTGSDEIPDDCTAPRPGAPDPDAVAYLQYTSGSTSAPKGVMVSHGNIVANSESIRRGFRHDEGSRSLTWLPHFHDMGLIDGILQPVYSGFPATLMDPLTFLQNPSRWLEIISHDRITHSGGPNFAYELAMRRVDPDPDALDLSSWAVAYNGAEPVRAATLEAFAARFERCGFRRSALYPAYGLAESTLKVSGPIRGDGARVLRVRRATLEAGRVETDAADHDLVSCGEIGHDTDVIIVDPETAEVLADNRIGEIRVAGPSVALGYWNRPEESAATFRATTPADSRPRLRTGDLGFLRDGQLYVTGRLKDLIIIRGRNLYPQDLERVAEGCSDALRPGAGAAFSVDVDGQERLVVVLEAERRGPKDRETFFSAVRSAIVESAEVDPWAILLVKPYGVPKTTSGKIQRRACRREFLDDHLPVLAEWHAPRREQPDDTHSADNVRSWLEARLAAKLRIPVDLLEPDRPLAAFGLDSLRSMELAHELERAWGVELASTELLSAGSLAALLDRVEELSSSSPGTTADPEIEVQEECELSIGQQALHSLHELAPESPAYTIASAIRWRGPLDPDALRRAAQRVVERHASLRARFVPRPGGPRQVFDVPFDAIFSSLRWSDVPDDELPERLGGRAYRPFDLARGPLLRLDLITRRADHVLLLSAHHAIADLWSLSVVLRDLRALYAAELTGRPAKLPVAPHPAEHIERERRWMNDDAGRDSLEFWKSELSRPSPALDLPTDRPRPPQRSFRGAVRAIPVPPALAERLRDGARARGVTLTSLLLSGFHAFLARLTGNPIPQVGVPAANRRSGRTSELVAFLVNSLVLRGDVTGDPSFEDLVRETASRLRAALEHQAFPFAALVRELAPPRDPSRSPLFDVMFDVRGTADGVRGDLAGGGEGTLTLEGHVRGEPLALPHPFSQFDLSVTVTDDGERLGMEFEYDTQLFDAARVEEIAEGFLALLSGALRQPDLPVSRLPILSEEQRTRVLGAAPRISRSDAPPGLARRFEECALRRPDAVAAHHRGESITYGELRSRAAAAASLLWEHGVGPDVPVAVSAEKSIDLLVGLMAVFRAGGTFVPVDPSLPPDRQRYLVEDSGARLVLGRPGHVTWGAPTLPLPRPVAGAATPPPADPPPDSLAYVIYTSGTTGRPKGVGVSHRNLAGAIRAWDLAYDLATLPVHLQMASPGFDVFLGDVSRALSSGAQLVLCDRELLLEPAAFADLCRRHRVAFGDFVPAVVRALARHVAEDDRPLDSFRIVVVGSDAWSTSDVPVLRKAFGGARLLNSYGVTEATVDNLFDDVGAEDAGRAAPPIGRAMANGTARVVDDRLQPVPFGVRGELVLGGAAVARGYPRDPSRTAERFVPDPDGAPGSRLYRTGDAARLLSDGRIEFLGRFDEQVKIRGYRVEPGEVESLLSEHADVSAAAVIAVTSGETRRLVAYVVAPEHIDESELRRHVAARVPDYMVPSAFVRLPALPLTPNGKIDRRALPAPPTEASSGRAPSAGAEQRMADVWCRVLDRSEIRADDDFFEIGGDSILAIELVSKARAAGLQISARQVFEFPTVAELAGVAACDRPPSDRPALQGEAPLLPMQEWFFRQDFAEPSHWNLGLAVRASSRLDPDPVHAALRAVLARHDALRARFERSSDGWRQWIEAPGAVEAPDVFSAEPGTTLEEAAARALTALHGRLDLERGPLLRVALVQDADERDALVLAVHHLVSDGVSLRWILEDLATAYRAAVAGEDIHLPPRTDSVADFARALGKRSEEAAGSDARDETAAWPRCETAATEGESVRRRTRWSAEETQRWLAGPEDPEIALLTSLVEAARRHGAPDRLALEREEHGREAADADVSRTVGWFTQVRMIVVDGLASASRAELPDRLRAALRAQTSIQGTVPTLSFNYLGRFDSATGASSLFERLWEPDAPRRSGRAHRTHALEVDAMVLDGRLTVDWSAHPDLTPLLPGLVDAFRADLLDHLPGGDVEEDLPLTPMQDGMLFHHLRHDDDPYVAQITLEFEGDLDVGRLARAWQAAVDIHPALRSSFVEDPDGRFRRRVSRSAAIPIRRHAPDADERLVAEAARDAGFDVGVAPLARVDLIPGADRVVAVFTHHHLLFDGWSLPLVLESVLGACARPDEPRARRDSSASRRFEEWRASRDPKAARAFFSERLGDLTAGTPLPLDRPTGDTGIGVIRGEAPADLVARVRRLGVTPATLVHAAWASVLATSTGRRDVVFGTTSAGRPDGVDGLADEVGLFITTLPVRLRTPESLTAREWLRDVQRDGARLREFEFAPLPDVQRCTGLPPHAPLFETLLVFENYPIDVRSLRERKTFRISRVALHEETHYPLTIVVGEGDGTGLRFLHDRSRLSRRAVETLRDRLTFAIETFLSHPDVPLRDLPRLRDDEREVVNRPNELARRNVRERAVGEIFAQHARSRPEAVALRAGDESWTYGRLDHVSAAIARALVARGLQPEGRVAVALPRSPEFVATVLGILRAGGVYVPLDAQSPPDRQTAMLADSRAMLLVADSPSAFHNVPHVPFDELAREGGRLETPLPDPPSADRLAYVIFTSGSTGQPKGIEITHRAIAHLVSGDYVRFGPGRTQLLLSTVAFDASTFEIWGALLHGAALAIAPDGPATAREIVDLVERHGVTTIFLTTGLFQVLAEEEPERLARIPEVLFGGDVIAPAVVRSLLERGATGLIHAYGPTETTTYATTHPLSPDDDLTERVPIGRPVTNDRAYVVDREMRLAPPGAPGELLLGGAGLARGYSSRADLTADRFVPDPFGRPGERLYRTGDVARWNADGRLEFLGRRDGQVKIRGFRVEVGEVEAALAAAEGVRSACVVAQGERGDVELVGYYVPEGDVDPSALRRRLERRLPGFMMPVRLLALDEMPLTARGKIDRTALPAPEVAASVSAPSRGPSTPAERTLLDLFSAVLGRESLSVDDDFFALGGHSLHATRVVSRIRRAFGVDLPLRALFDTPTAAALARRLERGRSSASVPIPRAPDSERTLASPAQRRLWFLDRLEPDSAAYNIASALHLEGDLDPQALASAFTTILERHEALRTRFREGDDGPRTIVEEPSPVEIPSEDLEHTADPAAEARRRVAEEARRPFDLSVGPLLRVRRLRLAQDANVLVLTMHHIIADGWSVGVLVHELAEAYRAHRDRREQDLPELPVQYADWAAWQRSYLEDGEGDRQLAYWKSELNELPALALPTDRPRPPQASGRGASFPVRIPADLVARARRFARAEGATLHMTLLAALSAVLGRWSGQEDFGIGTPVANRTREEAEPLLGVFVNSLVLRADLRGRTLSFRDLLARVRHSALRAYEHQDVPFERVVEAVAPGRDLSRTPLFQVMFILQNAPVGALDLGPLRIRPFEAPTGTSSFDLTFSLEPPEERAVAADGDSQDIVGDVEYSTDLFDEATLARLWSELLRLLDEALRSPEHPLRRLRLLSAEDRESALVEWSGRRDAREATVLLPERIAVVAERTPDAIAVVAGARSITYRHLEERVGRLAARLKDAGAGPGRRVALLLDRSPEFVAAVLAVWRTGAAYVPLDPSHPRDRLVEALHDADPAACVVTPETDFTPPVGRTLPFGPHTPDDGEVLSSGPSPIPEAAAYVIYTSGTTGRPKGVVVPHGSLAAAYDAWAERYELRAGDRHLQMAGVGFDVCAGDLVRALGSGATLVLADRETLLDPEALFELAHRERVTFAEFVPAVLRPLSAHAASDARRLDSLRIVAVGSDVWSMEEAAAFRATFGPDTRLANSYGVTEATIDSTVWFLDEGHAGGAHPPIGRPLAHATVHVLDDAGEPCPPGVVGDLFLGGPSVARGYLGRPDLTADRFVPDPFGPPGARAYRTGDRARFLRDGRLVFVGRDDDQVKVRGQRVELAEIEAALLRAPNVRAGAVVVRGEGEHTRLCAYVEDRGAGFDEEGARQTMLRRLPSGWIPASFTVLDRLPLTDNGKVDRRRLPEPASLARAFEEPTGEMERRVAAIYAEVLRLPRVGADDDFFALGGHSLLAVQVTSRLASDLGRDVPVRALFEFPHVRGLAASLDSDDGAPLPPVRPAPQDERRPASFAQRRLWFLDRLEPDTAAYHLPTLLHLEGAVDRDALRRALEGLVHRHEALRTCFVEGENGPEQRIDPAGPLDLPVVDLSGLPRRDRGRALQHEVRREIRRPFDLTRTPMLRAILYRRDDTRSSLLVTTHHIASDGWSLMVLARELGELYAAFVQGRPDPLPALRVQYADWSAWQRAWLAGGAEDQQLAHWRDALSDVPPLTLPFDRTRPVHPTFAGDFLPVRLEAPLRERLERLASDERATLHMVLLAAYSATLARWSGQSRFAVGTPVANRRTPEAETLIGFFVNTLALPVDTEGNALTFRDLLRSVRRTALEAHSHQDVPFERVVEDLDPERHGGRHPLFQVLFALQNVPVDRVELPGLRLTYDEPSTGATRFDLELFLAETERLETALPGAGGGSGALDGLLNYSTELFDRGTAERFLESFTFLVETVTARPDVPMGRLPALPPSHRRRVLRDWNAAREETPTPPPVHRPFEALAAKRPHAPALRHGSRRLSYLELDRRANGLARRLVTLGVGPESSVAIAVERSPDLVVSVLAVVKAGAAYVPIDPEHPTDRIAFLLEDSAASHVLTTGASEVRLPDDFTSRVRVDRDPEEADDPPAVAASPDSPVFHVYTSGSTGVPKGIAMTHRALSNLLSWQRDDSGRPMRTLQFAALSFDVSFQEIFSTLTAGGELVLVDEDERKDASALLRVLQDAQVERLFLPFVALSSLAETARAERRFPPSLVEVNTAGEVLRVTPALREFFERTGARLVNQYGPAETHVISAGEVEGPPADWPTLPSIGRPIRNAPLYLLDDSLQPVPIGSPGEIHAGGVAPARGYSGRADLTAERFVPDPFSSVPGRRLYRTGDVARFRSDGTLEFLGRRDRQVKIRGHRVEPGEIEAELARHPAVQESVVRDHEHDGGRRLVAYVVARPGNAPTADALRTHLARSLPSALVPAAIVFLEALPLSPHGKVNRDALPEPDWLATSDPTTGPRFPEEEIVVAAFAESLGVESIGIHDDFFALGGHSLLATRVLSRVRRALDVDVPLRRLFDAPTPAGLAAAALEFRERTTMLPPVRPASPAERRIPSPAQQRLWFLHRMNPDDASYNVPAAVRLSGPLNPAALESALAGVLHRHEALRTRFPEGPDGPEAVVATDVQVRLVPESAPVGEDADAFVPRTLREEAARPFDLAAGPVLRARLLRVADDEHVLSLVLHHIATDGASLRILWRELAEGYAAAVAGDAPSRFPLPVQYADYAAWQRRVLEGGELDRQLAFWRETLADAPPALELPTDRPRPAQTTARGATMEVRLSADVLESVSRLAREEGVTRHMVLLTAYAWTLLRTAGQDEVVIGTPVANRRVPEAEELIGFFVNTLPVRVRGDGNPSFRELLDRVRRASLDLHAHQDLPFERLVEELQPERALNRAPIFQTAFALQDLHFERTDAAGVSWTPLDVDNDTAKFDLMLLLGERGGELAGAFEYSTDLFDAASIKRLAGRFTRLLERALREPSRALPGIALASPAEVQRAMDGARGPSLSFAKPHLLTVRIEATVDRSPDTLACVGDSGSLTYAELERRANRLAHHLIDGGAGPEVRVALCLDRGPEAVVAMLAILKAGAAIVPLDPADPPERLASLVKDAGARLLITNSGAPLAAAVDVPVVLPDRDRSDLDARPDSRPEAATRPEHLAYLIYTSGSSGRPKAVGVEHRQIVSYVEAVRDRLELRDGFTYGWISTIAADLGHTALFPALTTGGTLVIVPPDEALDAPALQGRFGRHPIDVLKIVPSHLSALLSGDDVDAILPRRRLILGGEATSGAFLASLRERAPDLRVWNHYGPTETAVGILAGEARIGDTDRSTVPLGTPLAEARTYVLDDGLHPAAPGSIGELYLGGAGVARGYVDRPDLTADRFVPDPYGPVGSRMYRSGDRARLLPDGRLEFLGRVDDQVKVRGFRVEPGEIRAALERHADVRAAAVVVRDDGAAPGLVAYVVPDPRRAPTLRGQPRRVLPSGLAMAELNRNETDYLHREVVELAAYVRHGLTLRDGDTIFDVGANIGMFSAFASRVCDAPRIVAFEPNPKLHPILRANLAVYAPDARLIDTGVGESEGEAEFTFFPGFSLLSGLHADARVERDVVKSFVANQAEAGVEGAAEMSGAADELLAERFRGEKILVRLRPLSDVIDETGTERIHFLKVNVEKSELAVLRGIRDDHWHRIDQAVVEVDVAEHLVEIVEMFEAHDFDVLVDQDPLLDGTDLCYVHAVRRGSGRFLSPKAPPSSRVPETDTSLITAEELKEALSKSLPGSMQPAGWVFLDSLPVTPNGKLDRRRLPAPRMPTSRFEAPRGDAQETIARVWSELLGRDRVGAHDNFFDLGGHSLLLVRAHAALRHQLPGDLTVVDLFRFPTIASLAAHVSAGDGSGHAEAVGRERGRDRRAAMRHRARSSRPDRRPGAED